MQLSFAGLFGILFWDPGKAHRIIEIDRCFLSLNAAKGDFHCAIKCFSCMGKLREHSEKLVKFVVQVKGWLYLVTISNCDLFASMGY